MNLESSKVSVSKSQAYLFEALSDIKNFEKLMPENIAKFEVIDENCFEFGLKGMPEIKLVKKSATPNSEIILGAASSKLPFTLIAKLNEIAQEETEIQLFFEGDFNPMMAMMVKGPIGKFIETLAENMHKL
ncbi:SRPBCC family protein [Myroides sp. JBRI-B21084]|uniref:SRPBCC family protein n=1 Tax=Myroides sp. JBRI-B21084 TaxID=3119977 RepID=UPI0026E32076|nr:SRPBCC family protein [Paenimyroides cloacae]WKW47298.1 SRPBCC family protein [Paenimyroides cloacae]